MTQIDELREKMHADARLASAQMANISAAQHGQAYALRNELAQRHCPELLARYATLYSERQELGKDLQEAQHQVLALSKSAQPDFQRGAELTFRAQWLEDQIAQKEQALAQLDRELHSQVARAAAQTARQVKAESNRLTREKGAKQQTLVEQLNALEREYSGPLGELRRKLFALSAIVAVDMDVLRDGTYRE